MNAIERGMRDWMGRPFHMTPEAWRIYHEMSGHTDKPRKGFRQLPKNPKKGRRAGQ